MPWKNTSWSSAVKCFCAESFPIPSFSFVSEERIHLRVMKRKRKERKAFLHFFSVFKYRVSSDEELIKLRRASIHTLVGFLHCNVQTIQQEAWDSQSCWCESQRGAAAAGGLKHSCCWLMECEVNSCTVWTGRVSSELIKWKTHQLLKAQCGRISSP